MNLGLIDWVLAVGALVLLAALGGGLWRMFAGPTTLDRLVAFDAVLAFLIGLVVLASIHLGTADYLELMLVLAGLGFFTTVAFFYYLHRLEPGAEDFSGDPSRGETQSPTEGSGSSRTGGRGG